ncbi:MAG TPA: 5-(carboxyamino)imidazole ribonucleotide synthase [Mycobacteriales bacterium]|nr:5-(carboxyamino)imidazole ribonucleotide synthase [Mycobacteriales bacterium]
MSDLPVVGMVGGGQLARMTHQAAIALGVPLRVLADRNDDSAARVAAEVEIGAADDMTALTRFAKACDVLTFDHEHVPPDHLRALVKDGIAVRPGPGALLHAQDKLVQRRRLSELGIAVPAFAAVSTPDDIAGFGSEHGWPVVLKAVRGGYDGRGVWMLDEPPAELPVGLRDIPLYVEARVPIVHELAVQVARRPSGERRAWSVVETVQSDGICVEVIAPAPRTSPALAAEAEGIAMRLAEELDVTGLLAVELFEAPGGLLVNELAMRPHNSGHWSMNGARTSQFEQHLRAVLDWPLGDTSTVAPVTVMVNLLGGERTDLATTLPAALEAVPEAHVHLYGKSARPGRKLGHVNIVGTNLVEARDRAREAVRLLRGDADD